MENGPRRIALWGYGRYGARLFEAIRKNWADCYDITAVFDGGVREDDETVLDGGIPLLNAGKVRAGYESGSFEAILISVARATAYNEIAREVDSLGIPVTSLAGQEAFRPFDEFENTSSREIPYGITIHEYSSLYGFYHPLYPGHTQIYLFDEAGKGLDDLWYPEFAASNAAIWNPYRPLDARGADAIPMPGEYFLGVGLWMKNFWHFSYQTMDKIFAMEKAGFEGRYLLARAGFTEQLLSLLGLDLERVVWLDDLDPEAVYRFEKVFAADLSQSYSGEKVAPLLVDAGRVIGDNAGDDDREYPSRLYVKRIGIRQMLGADDVLAQYGFTTMIPEDYTLAEQIRFFKHADIVVSPHGAGLTNTLHMRPGTVLIETFGRRWVAPVFIYPLRLKGVHYFPLVQSPTTGGSYEASNAVDFYVDNTILAMMIESAIELVGRDIPSDAGPNAPTPQRHDEPGDVAQ